MKEHSHSPNELRRCVESAVRARGIHLYNSTGVPPSAKIFGKLEPLSDEIMKPGEIDLIAQDIEEDVHTKRSFCKNAILVLSGAGSVDRL